jgi:catechol 2,3-dioxygenase-like lactoylglutathione lyase family enzyme
VRDIRKTLAFYTHVFGIKVMDLEVRMIRHLIEIW